MSLQRVLINEKNRLTNADYNVNNVQNLVRDLIWNLFIQIFNAEVSSFILLFDINIFLLSKDSDGRFYTDSFKELSESTDNEP